MVLPTNIWLYANIHALCHQIVMSPKRCCNYLWLFSDLLIFHWFIWSWRTHISSKLVSKWRFKRRLLIKVTVEKVECQLEQSNGISTDRMILCFYKLSIFVEIKHSSKANFWTWTGQSENIQTWAFFRF